MASLRFLMLLSLSLGLLPVADGASYYVSPNGSGVIGSIAFPMGLSNALKSGVSPASAGDTIWLRGGAYPGSFNCTLSAPSNNPIVVRAYGAERPVISLTNEFALNGSGTWVWGLEFTDSNTNRYEVRRTGINFNSSTGGNANKLINCIIHDVGNGVFVSYQSTNAEAYGCVIYNIGYQLADRGHGHNLYVQNRSYSNSKLFAENIGLNAFNVGVNVRSSFETVNMVIRGNVEVNPGSLSTNGFASAYHTEGEPVDLITFDQNFCWFPSIGYGVNLYNLWTNGTLTLTSNRFVNSHTFAFYWTNVIFNGNIISGTAEFGRSPTNRVAADFNTYYNVIAGNSIGFNNTNVTLAEWQSNFGNDLSGSSTSAGPSGTWTYVRPNAYESGRANIIVYNWDTNSVVSVNVSGVLTTGQRYEVRNAADYFAPAVVSGTYAGENIMLPMTNLSVARPVGVATPEATGPRFNVFVLLPHPTILPPSNLKPL